MSAPSPPPRAASGPELRELLGLALPVAAIQVGLMAMGVVDTLIVGRVSPTALAAAALGHLYFMTVLMFGMGLIVALDPIVSQAVGANDESAIARGVQRGVVMSLLLTVPSALLMLAAGPLFRFSGQPAGVIPSATAFVYASIPGILPFYLFVTLRTTMQARGLVFPVLLTIIAANVLNAALNWVLVFGKLGAPALGVVGSAWASSIGRFAMTAMLLALAWPTSAHLFLPFRREALEIEPLRRMARIGLPIGGQFLLEVGVFSLVGLLMGRLGTDALAGHQVAINLASLTFMVPLGISTAAAVLVGRAIGAGNQGGVRHAARTSLLCAIAFEVVSATTLLLLPRPIARLYTPEEEVIAVAVPLLRLAGLFQLFDGIQVTCIGILRGTGDTRTPFLVNVLGYWLLGAPLSVFLGFRLGWGPPGLWWGFVLGLATVAVVLLLRVRDRVGRTHARLHIEGGPA